MPKKTLQTRSKLRKFASRFAERDLLLVLSLLIGCCCGLSAVLLDFLIKAIRHGATSWISEDTNFVYFILPGLGMFISLLLVRYVIRDKIGHGVTKVLVAVSKNESRIKPHNMWSSILTSSITIGLGGSVGAEAPIVYTGAAIGSNVARWMGMSHKNITILLGCGAAGAIAGIFKAPLAGILFTLEILLFNISMTSILPLLLSTVSATVVSYIFTGVTPQFTCFITPFAMRNIPAYLVLGIFCAACSLYFNKMTLYLEDKAKKIENPYLKWGICALLLGLLIFFFPPLYGEGYGVLQTFLSGETPDLQGHTPLAFFMSKPLLIPLFFLIIIVVKVFSMTFTNAGGGVGGTFGPTLFVGGIAGFVLVRVLNLCFPALALPESNFVLVGMAGLMAGVMQAPMTAIFLIAEITGGYDLLLPLIFASAVSFGVTRIAEKYSIYTKRIAASGDLLTHDSDQAVMTLLSTSELIRDKYPRVRTGTSVRSLVGTVSSSSEAVIAIVDAESRFKGVIDVDHVRGALFDTSIYDTKKVEDIMSVPPAFVYSDEKMDSVMEKFDRTDAWRLPVIDSQGVYLGFISKSRILMAYRSQLKEITSED